jgi:hypothetical protein
MRRIKKWRHSLFLEMTAEIQPTKNRKGVKIKITWEIGDVLDTVTLAIRP